MEQFKSKHIGFDMDGKVHRAMREYLFNYTDEKTIKEYMTELVVNDLKEKRILKENQV